MNKKRNLIVIGAAAMALSLSACSAGGGQAGVSAVSDIGASGSFISTTGEGSVKIVPDMGEITFAIYSEGADAKEVKDKNAKDNNKVIEFLREQGFEDESVKTSNLGMNPVYDYSSGVQIIKGYEMETEIKVSDIELSKLGDIIDASVDNGINTIRSVDYFVSNFDEQYAQALKLAVANAKSKAETLAQAGEVSVGEAINISEYGADTSQKYINGLSDYSAKSMSFAEGAADESAKSALMLPGQLEITASVSVDFEIK